MREFIDQDELRPQGEYSFNTWLERVPDLRNFLSLLWIIAEGGISDQTITGANSKSNLRKVWR